MPPGRFAASAARRCASSTEAFGWNGSNRLRCGRAGPSCASHQEGSGVELAQRRRLRLAAEPPQGPSAVRWDDRKYVAVASSGSARPGSRVGHRVQQSEADTQAWCDGGVVAARGSLRREPRRHSRRGELLRITGRRRLQVIATGRRAVKRRAMDFDVLAASAGSCLPLPPMTAARAVAQPTELTTGRALFLGDTWQRRRGRPRDGALRRIGPAARCRAMRARRPMIGRGRAAGGAGSIPSHAQRRSAPRRALHCNPRSAAPLLETMKGPAPGYGGEGARRGIWFCSEFRALTLSACRCALILLLW